MINVARTLNQVAYENTYFIYDEKTLLVVDPGSETEQILSAIEEIQLSPVAILLTHTHYDHIMSVEALRKKFSEIHVLVSPKEAAWLYTPEMNLSGLPRHDDMEDVVVQPADEDFEDYKTYTFGDIQFRVVPTPGHSIGGVSFVFDDFVVTGDALFKGGIGRWDLPTGNKEQLLQSIREELYTLEERLTILPGHGEASTIGFEKQFNPYF